MITTIHCLNCGAPDTWEMKSLSYQTTCRKCRHPFFVPPMPPTPPQTSRHTKLPTRRPQWIFPWILLGVWGSWAAMLILFFLWTVFDYEYIYYDRVFLANAQNYDLNGWIVGSILQTVFLGMVSGAVCTVASVITYFFLPKPQ